MFTAELYFNKSNGTPVTKKLENIEARNINHAMRRIVKTITGTGKYGLHTHFNIWNGDKSESMHVYVNQVMGQHAGVYVNDVQYSPADWVNHFQG